MVGVVVGVVVGLVVEGVHASITRYYFGIYERELV